MWPIEPSSHQTGQGNLVAEYGVASADALVARVALWSGGVTRESNRSPSKVQVTFDVDNVSDAELVLAHVVIDAISGPVSLAQELRPSEVTNELRIGAHTRRLVELTFFLPGEPSPTSVRALWLRWTIRAASATATYRTAFASESAWLDAATVRNARWCSPFSDDWFDPWCRDPYGRLAPRHRLRGRP